MENKSETLSFFQGRNNKTGEPVTIYVRYYPETMIVIDSNYYFTGTQLSKNFPKDWRPVFEPDRDLILDEEGKAEDPEADRE